MARDNLNETAALQAVAWGPNPVFNVEPLAAEVPIDPRQFDKIMALARQHLVRRLLLAVHYLCCREAKLDFAISEQELSRLAWATRRPHHWQSYLKTAADRAVAVSKSWSPGSVMAIAYSEGNRSYLVSVPPSFFGSLTILVRTNRRLVLFKRNPEPDKKLSRKQLSFLRDHGWQEDGDGKPYNDSRLRMIVRSECTRYASVPTLAGIARSRKQTGGYRTIFIPAGLGDEQVCRELGPLVNVLIDNHTRGRNTVNEAKITGSAPSAQTIICSLLDPEKTYTTFAGNQGARGYRPAVWAKMLRTNIKMFLNRLAAAKDPLGLLVIGVDRENHFYDLSTLAGGTAALWEKVGVRIYAERDYRRRWAAVLGWQPPESGTTVGTKQKPELETDLAILRQRVLEVGLRKTARDTGIAGSHLSTYLKYGRGLSIQAVAEVRQRVLESQNLGDPDAVELFNGCQELAEWAVAYRKLGWCVIPIVPGTRASYIHWKPFQTALPTVDQIRRWWKMWPNASIGIILGPISGLLVIDSDSMEANDILVELLGDVLNRCPMVLSGSRLPGKFHYYFRHPPIATKAKNTALHPQLEIRGTNGLIITDPSVHKSGRDTYAWAEGQAIWQVPLIDTPPAILEILQASQKKSPVVVSRPAPAIKGSGGFTENFSHWNGQRAPGDVAEFLRGEHAHTNNHDWNERLFRCARWCRNHQVPQDVAELCLVRGAANR